MAVPNEFKIPNSVELLENLFLKRVTIGRNYLNARIKTKKSP
jgi:hypothetical protein